MRAHRIMLFAAACLLLLLENIGCTRGAPKLPAEYDRLVKVLDSTIEGLNLDVQRSQDIPPVECTELVGWVSTGKYRKGRHVLVSLASPSEMRDLLPRIAGRWRAAGFETNIMEKAESGVLLITAKDKAEATLGFVGYPNSASAYLTTETACLRP